MRGKARAPFFRQGMEPNLVHEKWTGPSKVVKVVLKG